LDRGLSCTRRAQLAAPAEAVLSDLRTHALVHDGTYVELNGGHFALLLDRDRATTALARWLARL
jgi:hypothetical protein